VKGGYASIFEVVLLSTCTLCIIGRLSFRRSIGKRGLSIVELVLPTRHLSPKLQPNMPRKPLFFPSPQPLLPLTSLLQITIKQLKPLRRSLPKPNQTRKPPLPNHPRHSALKFFLLHKRRAPRRNCARLEAENVLADKGATQTIADPAELGGRRFEEGGLHGHAF
jgi:hypothetical protein